MFATVYLCTL